MKSLNFEHFRIHNLYRITEELNPPYKDEELPGNPFGMWRLTRESHLCYWAYDDLNEITNARINEFLGRYRKPSLKKNYALFAYT